MVSYWLNYLGEIFKPLFITHFSKADGIIANVGRFI